MERIIDFHTHAFPEKIAHKAAVNLSEFYSFPVDYVATAAALSGWEHKAKVEKAVVCTTATAPMQVQAINNFIKGLESDLFVPFGSLHPDYPDVAGEVERIAEMGLHGLKLHPDFQQFDADDPKAKPIYKALERHHLPLLIHCGDPVREYSRPHKVAQIKQWCPDLTIIAAHLGGYKCNEEAEKYIIGQDFYVDTSSSLWYLTPEKATEMILAHGTDKVLFGTDYPVMGPDEELKRFRKLGLNKRQRQDILFNNAARLLGLE